MQSKEITAGTTEDLALNVTWWNMVSVLSDIGEQIKKCLGSK